MIQLHASNQNVLAVPVTIAETPKVSFDVLEVAAAQGGIAYVVGDHKWERLTTTSDLSALQGQWFTMENEEWVIGDCIQCADGSIYIKNAYKKS